VVGGKITNLKKSVKVMSAGDCRKKSVEILVFLLELGYCGQLETKYANTKGIQCCLCANGGFKAIREGGKHPEDTKVKMRRRGV